MNFSAESKLEASESRREPPQRHPADEEEVDVAGSTVFRASGRAVDERGDKVLGHGLQGGAESRNEAAGFCEEGGELRQKGAVRVRLEVDTIPVLSTPKDSGTSEPFEVALKAGGRKAEVASEIAQIPGPVGVKKERSEDLASDAGKEGGDGRCTHYALVSTQFAYKSINRLGRVFSKEPSTSPTSPVVGSNSWLFAELGSKVGTTFRRSAGGRGVAREA